MMQPTRSWCATLKNNARTRQKQFGGGAGGVTNTTNVIVNATPSQAGRRKPRWSLAICLDFRSWVFFPREWEEQETTYFFILDPYAAKLSQCHPRGEICVFQLVDCSQPWRPADGFIWHSHAIWGMFLLLSARWSVVIWNEADAS